MDQLEWLTGGECAAGMHEVVVSESTLQAVEAAKKAGRSLWRVSSTVSDISIEFFCYELEKIAHVRSWGAGTREPG